MSVGRRMAESFQTSVRVNIQRASNRASGEIGHRSTGKLSFEGKPASQQSQAEVKFRGAGAVAKRVYSQSRAVDTVQAYVWCLAKPIRTA